MANPKTDSAAIRQYIRALIAAGYALDSVFDGDSYEPEDGLELDEYGDQIVKTETHAIELIAAVDVATLYVAKDGIRSSILFVMGNSPEEVACDYSTNLEDVMSAVSDSWDCG